LVWAVIKGYSVERAPTFRGAAGPAWPRGLATGVSSLYAAVILVTLAVVAGAAYAAWVMGVLGSIWGSPELLYIYPNSSLMLRTGARHPRRSWGSGSQAWNAP